MKLFLAFGVCILCISQVISQTSADARDLNEIEETIESKIQVCRVARKKIGFMDLKEDCLLVVFENLDLTDLLTLGNTKKHFKRLVKVALRRKFAGKKVTFRLMHSTLVFHSPMEEDANGIYFHDTKEWRYFEEILRDYGQLFSNLHVRQFTLPSQHKEVPRLFALINSYCSDSVKKMNIMFCISYNIFDRVQKPFEKLEQLTLDDSFGNLHNENFTFAQLFPSLKHLTFPHFFTTDDLSFLDENFPNLIHLQTFVSADRNGVQDTHCEQNIKQFIRSNPQLLSLTLTIETKSTGLYLLDFLTKALPNLERLVLINYDEENVNNQNVAIHFENLKEIVVHSNSVELPSKTTFGIGLEEIEFGLPSTWYLNEGIDIVLDYKNLRKLTVKKPLRNSDIHKIANSNLNLEEFTFIGYDYSTPPLHCDVNVETIIELIENNEQLKKLHFSSKYATVAIETLRNHLPIVWTISSGVLKDLDYIVLQRN